MKTLTTRKAVKNLSEYIEQGRLVQSAWAKDEGGRHLGCLLHAIGNGDVKIDSVKACPASVMPQWAAEWTVLAFDGLDPHSVYPRATLYRDALEKSVGFKVKQWDEVARRFGSAIVRDAIDYARSVLHHVREGEGRPRLAIEAAEKCLAEPTEENRNAAARAAAAAGADALAAGADALAAWAAARAARAAAEAAWAARAAAGDAMAAMAARAAYARQFQMFLDAVMAVRCEPRRVR